MEKSSESTTTTKVPVLKITINKKYHGTPMLNSKQQKHKNTPNTTNNAEAVSKVHTSNLNVETKSNETNQLQDVVVSPKPVIINLLPVVSEKPVKRKNAGIEIKNDIFIPKTAYTRKGDLSRDNVRNQTSAERLRYLYTKAQRDCDILRIRLKALRERQKQEEEEIKKLQLHLGAYCKDINDESLNENSEVYPKRRRTSITFEDQEQEDEYEKLLREVRKIKHDLLNQRYVDTETNNGSEIDGILRDNRNGGKRETRKLLENNHVLKVNNVECKEVIDEVYNKCDEDIKRVNEESNTSFKSEDQDSVYFEEVYLEPVFIN